MRNDSEVKYDKLNEKEQEVVNISITNHESNNSEEVKKYTYI